VRDLAVINVKTDHYLLSLDHFIGHAPIVRIDLVPLLCDETLHELLGSEVQNEMIFMGHQILSCHVPVVKSFSIYFKIISSS
jgi:hypothetical protein